MCALCRAPPAASMFPFPPHSFSFPLSLLLALTSSLPACASFAQTCRLYFHPSCSLMRDAAPGKWRCSPCHTLKRLKRQRRPTTAERRKHSVRERVGPARQLPPQLCSPAHCVSTIKRLRRERAHQAEQSADPDSEGSNGSRGARPAVVPASVLGYGPDHRARRIERAMVRARQ